MGRFKKQNKCNSHPNTGLLNTAICCTLSFVLMNNGEHVYIKIPLILFSKGAHSLFLVWEIDEETYTQRGDFFLSHIFFREPWGANACTPLPAVSSETSETPLIGCLSLARLSILCTLSKSDRMVLISRGLLPVTHLLERPAPTRCHPPVYGSQCDSLSKRTGSLGTNPKSMSYVI